MVSFKPKDPQFRSRVERSFNQQQVMKTLGVKIVSLQPGEIELMMPYVGQGAELLETRGRDGLSDRVIEASYSASRSFLTTSS